MNWPRHFIYMPASRQLTRSDLARPELSLRTNQISTQENSPNLPWPDSHITVCKRDFIVEVSCGKTSSLNAAPVGRADIYRVSAPGVA